MTILGQGQIRQNTYLEKIEGKYFKKVKQNLIFTLSLSLFSPWATANSNFCGTNDNPTPLTKKLTGTASQSLMGSRSYWSGCGIFGCERSSQEISFCISDAFMDQKSVLVSAIISAAIDWQKSINVNFKYRPEFDHDCYKGRPGVVYTVIPAEAHLRNDGWSARASYPNQHPSVVEITDSAFWRGREHLAGIMRHELGHTLGFAHEHSRMEACASLGTTYWNRPDEELTDYDPFSVMHYKKFKKCMHKGNDIYNLSMNDRSGAQKIYGRSAYATRTGFWETIPAEDYEFFDPAYYALMNDDIAPVVNQIDTTDMLRGAYLHFQRWGKKEGREFSRVFNIKYYLATQGDVAHAFGRNNYPMALLHYYTSGVQEGRPGSAIFSAKNYFEKYQGELEATFGPRNYLAAIKHYQNYGLVEGR